MEHNNCIELSRADLHLTLEQLNARVMSRDDRVGLPRASYRDSFDSFKLRIERSNLGYSVTGTLNGEHSHQLNGRFFSANTQIGAVMLLAAGAPDTATVASFFD